MDAASNESNDVRDTKKLARYREMRRRCVNMISGTDDHAIGKQMTALLATDLEFRTINFARRICEQQNLPQNGMVHLFINRGFISHQALTIRRITEEDDGTRPKWAVYSIPRIIREIQQQRDLHTRENYVCSDGSRYEESVSGCRSRASHASFDELSHTTRSQRSRDDLIHVDVFNELKTRLKSSTEIVRTYTNKILAHAADPLTRSGNEGVCLHDLENAYRDLIWVTNQLSAKILNDISHRFLPHPLVDNLASLDQPICPSGELSELKQYWKARQAELEALESDANGFTNE